MNKLNDAHKLKNLQEDLIEEIMRSNIQKFKASIEDINLVIESDILVK